jgi:hypothetical protein
MRSYINTDTATRTWLHIQMGDSSTLELDPGKGVDLDTCSVLQLVKGKPGEPDEWKMVPIPIDFSDEYLKPEPKSAKAKKETVDAATA